MKLWHPTFSVRTLAIFVTLICVYFGAWEATKRYGLETIDKNKPHTYPLGQFTLVSDNYSPVALVIRRDEYDVEVQLHRTTSSLRIQRYYLWVFGPKFRLPFESTMEDIDSSFVFP